MLSPNAVSMITDLVRDHEAMVRFLREDLLTELLQQPSLRQLHA